MGAGASTASASIADPFPVSPGLARDLDKLSMVAARILSTPDIYDVENLGKPGTCGDYMVLLKKGLEKKLLPFVAKTSKGNQEIVYQNPRKAIDNIEDRKKICASLVNTMLRTITIVVACLASIQVASTSREVVVASQRGGAMTDVRDWLIMAGYLTASAAGAAPGTELPLTMDAAQRGRGITMHLTFRSSSTHPIEAYLGARVDAASGTPPMPAGSIKVQFLNPLPIPGTAKSLLPLRIVDEAGQPWLAGALYDNVFKSFYATTAHESLLSILENLFRRTQGAREVPLLERRTDTIQANEVFQTFRRTNNAAFIFQTLNTWLQTYVSGYNPATAGLAPGAGGFPVAGFPGAFPGGFPGGFAGAGPGGFPVAGFPGGVPPVRPLGFPLSRPTPFMPVSTGGQQFDIPITSAKVITDSFKVFRDLLPRQSSPAHVRAYALAGRLNPNRTVDSGICQDPYWRDPTLAKVYPWATLQFLCIKDWARIAPGNTANFENDWASFVRNLTAAYGQIPELRFELRAAGSSLLEQMSVKGYDKLPICGRPQPFSPIQEGIATMQELYKAHVPKVWALLNELIVVIQVEDDNGVKRDVVRLHPMLVTGTTQTTEEYVTRKAAAARELLVDFYSKVEESYVGVIKKLTG